MSSQSEELRKKVEELRCQWAVDDPNHCWPLVNRHDVLALLTAPQAVEGLEGPAQAIDALCAEMSAYVHELVEGSSKLKQSARNRRRRHATKINDFVNKLFAVLTTLQRGAERLNTQAAKESQDG